MPQTDFCDEAKRNSTCSENSSTSDPTVSTLGVRHTVRQNVTSSALMSRSALYESGNKSLLSGVNSTSMALSKSIKSTGLPAATASLSSGTGTASPVSSSSPHLSTCSSTLAVNEPNQMTTADLIIREIVDTETSYVRDLEDVIIGYIVPLRIERILSESDIQTVFSNIEEIYYLNKRLLLRIQRSTERSSSLSSLSRCFSDKMYCEKMIATYRCYCQSFATSSARLESILQDPHYASVSLHMKDLQISLGHSLPLFSYLLKPVQRILKYQLLWQKLADQFEQSTHEHMMATEAAINMVKIAQLINSCVSLPKPSASHEHSSGVDKPNNPWRSNNAMTMSSILPTFSSISAQKQVSTLRAMTTTPHAAKSPSINEKSSVRIVLMQGKLLLRGAKNLRYVMLFDSLFTLYKIHKTWRKSQEHEELLHQCTIPATSLVLRANESTSFCVESAVDSKISHIFVCDSKDACRKWCVAIHSVITKASSRLGKRHSLLSGSNMSTSVFVSSPRPCENDSANSRKKASPIVIFGEKTIPFQSNPAMTSSCIEKSADRSLLRPHIASTQRFASVGSGIEAQALTPLNSMKQRDSWPAKVNSPADFHKTINRTDSEKWRERNRVRMNRSATIDRLEGFSKRHFRHESFVRRSSFVCESHLLRISQNDEQVPPSVNGSEDAIAPVVVVQTPISSNQRESRRSSRSHGLRRLFDAVAKRFRLSNERVNNKQDSFSNGEPRPKVLHESAANTVTCSDNPSLNNLTSPLSLNPSIIVEAAIGNEKPVNFHATPNGIGNASKQKSFSVLQSPSKSQLLARGKGGLYKKKVDAKVAKLTHWPPANMPQDVFV